jgi:hypothetical protein
VDNEKKRRKRRRKRSRTGEQRETWKATRGSWQEAAAPTKSKGGHTQAGTSKHQQN